MKKGIIKESNLNSQEDWKKKNIDRYYLALKEKARQIKDEELQEEILALAENIYVEFFINKWESK